MQHNAMIGVHDDIKLPACNELVAVLIGCDMAEPGVPASDKEALNQFLGKSEDVNIVYKQNTADEVNIAVPVFPEFDRVLAEMEMDEEYLEYIVGGEGLVAGIIALISVCLTTIGGIVAAKAGFAGVGAVTAAVIGATVISAVGAGTLTAIGATVAGVGVGIAAAAGAFAGSGSDVNVGLAS